LARRLDQQLDQQVHGSLRVVGRELPTAYRGALEALQALLEPEGGGFRAILALGVHRGEGFRIERQAGAREVSDRLDVWGEAFPVALRHRASTRFDVEACARVCQALSPLPVWISEDAGGYVCDFTYGQVLRLGEAFGIPALFLHVPPAGILPVAEQLPVVRGLVEEVWRQVETSL
ncbi:MAG TPA: hypothetical protein PLJ12_12465, partial [Planctomycetota bacterium]|nr:hypothetical protein [Planctomycetota bacterium]